MTWYRKGDFQLHTDGRHAIHRTLLSHGVSYALYDCEPGDWPPIELLCVRDSAVKCQKFLEDLC